MPDPFISGNPRAQEWWDNMQLFNDHQWLPSPEYTPYGVNADQRRDKNDDMQRLISIVFSGDPGAMEVYKKKLASQKESRDNPKDGWLASIQNYYNSLLSEKEPAPNIPYATRPADGRRAMELANDLIGP